MASLRGERREREGESRGRKVDVRGGLEGKEGRRTEGRRGRGNRRGKEMERKGQRERRGKGGR